MCSLYLYVMLAVSLPGGVSSNVVLLYRMLVSLSIAYYLSLLLFSLFFLLSNPILSLLPMFIRKEVVCATCEFSCQSGKILECNGYTVEYIGDVA